MFRRREEERRELCLCECPICVCVYLVQIDKRDTSAYHIRTRIKVESGL